MRITKFGRDITTILIIKLILLYSLWDICFKHTKQNVVGDRFANQVFGIAD